MKNLKSVMESVSVANKQFTDIIDSLHFTLDVAVQDEDYLLVKEIIRHYLQEVEKLHVGLQDALTKVVELVSDKERRDHYGERWWQEKRHELYSVFEKDAQEGLNQWLRTYVDVLIDWELPTCEKLAVEPFPFPPQTGNVSYILRDGTKGIVDGEYQQVLDMLEYLTQVKITRKSQLLLNNTQRATLLVFMGRIFLYKLSEREASLKSFERAKELASKDGRSYSALGEYHRLGSEPVMAKSFYQQGIELSPRQSDGYIGMGMLLEDQGLWDEANDWYDEAAETVQNEKNPGSALGKLLIAISGNAYLRLAKALKEKDSEHALQAIETAINTGIRQNGAYPEWLGYGLKGEILENQGRVTEAAEAYYKAGEGSYWRDEYKDTEKLLTKAKELNPNYVPIYWYLSDSLSLLSSVLKPPYVDEEIIKRGRDIWEQGYKIEPPNDDFFWAYVTRARINELLADLPDADQWDLWWQAITFLERGIFSNDVDAQYMAYLGRYYRFVEANASALQATTTAVEADSKNFICLDEHALALYTIRAFDAAEEIIVKRRELEADDWIDSFNADILLSKGSFQDSLNYVQRALKIEPDNINYRSVQAECYLMLNEPLLFEKEYEWIWNQYHELDSRNLLTFGWAAYITHRYDEAIKIFRKLLEEPLGVGNTTWNLGLCYLSLGDLARGEEYMTQGIELTKSVRELVDFQTLDLYTVEQPSVTWSKTPLVRELLRRVKKKIKMRRSRLEQPHSIEDELKEIISKFPLEDGKPNRAWIGAHAGLGRFYAEDEQWSKAAGTYKQLQSQTEQFPEAHNVLEVIYDILLLMGDDRVREDKPDDALQQYTQIPTLELLPNDKIRQAHLYCRLGYLHFTLNDNSSSQRYFTKALALYHESVDSSPGSAIGDICRSLISNAAYYWDLDAMWREKAEAPDTDEALRSDFTAARKSLEGALDELYQLSERSVDTFELSPIATPIQLQLGSGLIPEDTGQEWPLLKFYIPEMHQRFHKGMGIDLPSTVISEDNDMSTVEYSILLNEAFIARGSVPLDMRYCTASSETIVALGIPKETFQQASHPLTGKPGCWIRRDSWELITKHNLELWAEPLVFIVQHLEAVLFRHLDSFLGVQEVDTMLSDWSNNEDAASLIAVTLPDQDTRYRFTQVLRALVRERVPITSWREILETFKSLKLENATTSKIMRSIRLRLKHILPGNNADVQHFVLPQEWELNVTSLPENEKGEVFFIAPPKETEILLSSIQYLLDSVNGNVVLVTRRAELRPFARQLFEDYFPDLMVLSQEELLSLDGLQSMILMANAEQIKGD